jgi:hypothetical protein
LRKETDRIMGTVNSALKGMPGPEKFKNLFRSFGGMRITPLVDR